MRRREVRFYKLKMVYNLRVVKEAKRFEEKGSWLHPIIATT